MMVHGFYTDSLPPAPPPRMAARHLLAIGSGRGGSGKTTVALSVAFSLSAEHGRRVALVDLDPQASCTLYAGSRPSLDPLADAPVVAHQVVLYRGGEALAAASAADIQAQLRRAGADADVVVVDLPPALTNAAHPAVLGYPASLLIMAVELEPGSMQPAAKLAEMARQSGVPVQVLGNKLNARAVTAGALMTLQGTYGDRLSSVLVPDDAKAPESIAVRKPLTAYKPKSKSAQAVQQFTRELVAGGRA